MAREMQKERSEVLKQQILNTAIEIGLEEGFDQLSIRKIIKKMDYSTSIIYYHFKNKQEVIDGIVASETERLHKMIQKVVDRSQDLITQIHDVFQMITLLAVRDPEKYNLVVLRKYSSKNEGTPPWMTFISGQLKQGMESGLIRKADPSEMAFSVWSSFLGFHLMLSLQENLSEAKALKMFDMQLSIIMKGIQT